MNENVCVIIPIYNEAKVIGDVVRKVKKRYSNVVCVDDGSRDGSGEEARQAGGSVVTHAINLGQGAALQTGLDFALLDPRMEYFVTYDADGQHSLDDVDKMVKTIERQKVDIVLGSRFLGKAQDISTFKKWLLKAAVRFSNATSGLRLTDAHNGLRVFNRKVAAGLNITMPDYSHASEIVERIAQKKYSYVEVPVTIHYTEYSRSKGQSWINAINIAFDVILNKLGGKR